MTVETAVWVGYRGLASGHVGLLGEGAGQDGEAAVEGVLPRLFLEAFPAQQCQGRCPVTQKVADMGSPARWEVGSNQQVVCMKRPPQEQTAEKTQTQQAAPPAGLFCLMCKCRFVSGQQTGLALPRPGPVP